MRKFLSFVFFLFFTIEAYSEPVTLELKIYNPKESYLTAEPIWVEYTFTNTTQNTLWIQKIDIAMGGNARFLITTDEGKEILIRSLETFYIHVCPPLLPLNSERKGSEYEKWKERCIEISRKSYRDTDFWKGCCIKLPPGEQSRDYCNLSDYYYDLFNPGTYYLKGMIYESLLYEKFTESELGVPITPDYLPFWKGKLEAKIDFVIRIKEPQGEEKEAREIFIRAEKEWEKGRKQRPRETRLDLYFKSLKLYPNSVYAPWSYDLFIHHLESAINEGTVSNEIFLIELEKFLTMYSDSPFTFDKKEPLKR